MFNVTEQLHRRKRLKAKRKALTLVSCISSMDTLKEINHGHEWVRENARWLDADLYHSIETLLNLRSFVIDNPKF